MKSAGEGEKETLMQLATTVFTTPLGIVCPGIQIFHTSTYILTQSPATLSSLAQEPRDGY